MGWSSRTKKKTMFFVEKRTKKLLLGSAGMSSPRQANASRNEQKFFGSFFRK
jgi:hypothetical protein